MLCFFLFHIHSMPPPNTLGHAHSYTQTYTRTAWQEPYKSFFFTIFFFYQVSIFLKKKSRKTAKASNVELDIFSFFPPLS